MICPPSLPLMVRLFCNGMVSAVFGDRGRLDELPGVEPFVVVMYQKRLAGDALPVDTPLRKASVFSRLRAGF